MIRLEQLSRVYQVGGQKYRERSAARAPLCGDPVTINSVVQIHEDDRIAVGDSNHPDLL